jgi:glycerol-3-phosphate dehydrogenase (NAD(P)+)
MAVKQSQSSAHKAISVAVLGGGSFGTAIANLIAANGHDVCLWLRNEARANEINEERMNSFYLPDITLNDGVSANTELADVVSAVKVVFLAVPSSSCRDVSRQLKHLLNEDAFVVSLTKGIEAASFKLMSQVIAEELPDCPVGVMSGPNLAKEIAEGHLTATVVASQSQALTQSVQEVLGGSTFRVYAGSDTFGVELAGALKNCYAIMCGMASALGLGQNTIGMLITRSITEMSRFAVKLGADPITFMGLAGVGDLVVTCMSPLSRNYRVGFALGEGKRLDDIVAELGQVAEGVNTLKLVQEKAQQLDIYMPLVSGMFDILYHNTEISEVISRLMEGEQSQDVEYSLLTPST